MRDSRTSLEEIIVPFLISDSTIVQEHLKIAHISIRNEHYSLSFHPSHAI